MRTNLVLVLVVTGACSGGSTLVTGKIADGFPSPVTAVKVLQGGVVVATAPVGASGDFQAEVPSHATVSLRLVGAGYVNLVMPRRSGTRDRSFTTHGGDIDLGAIKFVGDAATAKFVFRASASEQCTFSCHEVCVGDPGGGDDVGCDGDGTGGGSGGGGAIGRDAPGSDGTNLGDAVPEFDAPSCGGSGSGTDGSGSGIVL
jgi:hypothetical protein